MARRHDKRSVLPEGVYYKKDGKNYVAKCVDPFKGKQVYLGSFYDADSAHVAWKKKKKEIAERLSEEISDPKIKQALKNRYS